MQYTYVLVLVFCFERILSTRSLDYQHISQHTGRRLKRQGENTTLPAVKCLKDGESLSVPSPGSSTTSLEVCCEGFLLSPGSKCIPQCKVNCPNGFCSSPNSCECFTNHTLDLSGNCIPTCPLGCSNGKCLSDGMCDCNNGFLLGTDRKFCQPFCPEGCPSNMNCSAPGTCTCRKGYTFGENGICVPACEKNCLNGNCIEPNICSCLPGFTMADGVCQAKCENDCKNGKCILRDVCICDPGYTYNITTNKCDAVCNECENGKCLAPNNCQCDEGYVKFETTCKPFCLDGCKNGYCIAPYTCVCKDGYGKNPTGSCMKLNCKLGFTEKECTIYHAE